MADQGTLLASGRDALRRGDGATAAPIFEELLAIVETGAAFEGLAKAAYLQLDYPRSIELWERAYAAYQAANDEPGAIRTARMLAYMYGTVVGDAAVMRGWHARASTLLAGQEDSVDHGWVSLNRGLFEEDRAAREQCFRQALDAAERFHDANLHFSAIAYLGASLVHDDRVEEGMSLLDEACAAVAGADVEEFQVLEEIFCQLFSACEHTQDVARADSWARIAEDIAARRNLPTVSAFCRTHYGGVLTAAGRWDEADAALTAAVQLWAVGHSMLRSGALIRLADLRVLQGRFEEAEQLLEGFELWAEAARAVAAIHLSRGKVERAAEVLHTALASTSGAGAASLLASIVEVELERGRIDEAEAAAATLRQIADRHGGHYLRATAALATGRVCLVSGTGDPRQCLREALAGFSRAQLPLELARARFELASALTAESPEVAVAEATAALDAFQRLQAARHVDATTALLRQLGAPARTGPKGDQTELTKREAEVLELLGHGLTNPEISDRLFISRKTVEHHVGKILSKLGLRSRAEVAAHVARRTISP